MTHTPCLPSSADTTRERQKEETLDGADGYFHVSEDIMKADIQAHKFIEYGRHQQQLYGIKSDTVEEVMRSGKIVVLDVYPQVSDCVCVYVCVCVCVCVCVYVCVCACVHALYLCTYVHPYQCVSGCCVYTSVRMLLSFTGYGMCMAVLSPGCF